jgi:hypothetical protein
MYYDDAAGQCGNYDTENFIAADACCACGGGSTTGYGGWGRGGQYGVGWSSGGGSGGIPVPDEPLMPEPVVEEPLAPMPEVEEDTCTNDDTISDSY